MSTTVTAPAAVAVWFEIPAVDFERAVRFYETLFATTLKRADFGGELQAVFPYEGAAVSGSIVDRPAQAGATGATVYLASNGPLDDALARVPAAGGRIAVPKTALGPNMGWFATIVDPEGNRIGLHAMS